MVYKIVASDPGALTRPCDRRGSNEGRLKTRRHGDRLSRPRRSNATESVTSALNDQVMRHRATESPVLSGAPPASPQLVSTGRGSSVDTLGASPWVDLTSRRAARVDGLLDSGDAGDDTSFTETRRRHVAPIHRIRQQSEWSGTIAEAMPARMGGGGGRIVPASRRPAVRFRCTPAVSPVSYRPPNRSPGHEAGRGVLVPSRPAAAISSTPTCASYTP